MVSTGTPSRAANFHLGQSRAPAKIAGVGVVAASAGATAGSAGASGNSRPSRQFDDPSIRFQPQPLHARPLGPMVGDAR